jgi:hypothetical protein
VQKAERPTVFAKTQKSGSNSTLGRFDNKVNGHDRAFDARSASPNFALLVLTRLPGENL